MSVQLNRRRFLATATAVASGCMVGQTRRVRAQDTPLNKVSHACIGVGGMGWHDMHNFKSHTRTQIVAICDVDANHLQRAKEALPEARCYSDWRELLAKEGDKIDSINIAVPDHMHAIIAIAAMQAGKHVYCQKPLCHDVAECRALSTLAKSKGVVTQLGTQHASGVGDRMGVQWLREGAVGVVQRVVLCSNRKGAIDSYRFKGPRPAKGEPAPEHLNWELWLGTAPVREYAPKLYHPAWWRCWQDFGTGWSGDIGCHIFDAVWKGMELGNTAPLTVKASVQESWKSDAARRADTWPQKDHITWTFPGCQASGDKPYTVEWLDGFIMPSQDILEMTLAAGFEEYPEEAATIIGSEGAMLLPHTSGPILLPKEKFRSYPRPKLPPRNHYHHFIDTILGEAKCESQFCDTAGPMAETILLGTVAIRVPDTELQWDAQNMRIVNSDAANKLLRRQYRQGWETTVTI